MIANRVKAECKVYDRNCTAIGNDFIVGSVYCSFGVGACVTLFVLFVICSKAQMGATNL